MEAHQEHPGEWSKGKGADIFQMQSLGLGHEGLVGDQ